MANGNLFGSFDPRMTELALQQEQQRNMIEQAKMDPAAYLRYSAGLRGQMIGQGVANLFGTGRIDPRLQQASDAQAAYNEALSTVGDATSSAFFRAFANAAAKRNIPTLAQQAAEQAMKVEELEVRTQQTRTQLETNEIDYFKANPEQSGIVLQEIATQLEQDPTNPQLLKRYNRIATAATSGAVKAFEESNKNEIDTIQNGTILPDGTVIGFTKQGKRIVRDANGNLVTGEAAAKAIKQAQDYGVEIQSERAGGRAGATSGIKLAEGAITTAGKLRSNVGNLQEAIDALDKGANTGSLSDLFPNLTTASIELNNVRNRLGLDVVGSVTFGALSEAELELALATALPTNLNERDLRAWIQRKMTAQQKLADYLEKQAQYLYGGGSVAGWLELQRQQRERQGGAVTQPPSRGTTQPAAPSPTVIPSGVKVERIG